MTNAKEVFSNLLKFTSSDQSEGGGGAKPINQSFKDQVMLIALINNFVPRMQENSTLAPHYVDITPFLRRFVF